jgi:hypothetical protein
MTSPTLPNLDLVIDEDGTLHLEVNGCEGTVCETITEALLQRMGTVEDVQRKPEYYITQDRPDYLTNEDSGE